MIYDASNEEFIAKVSSLNPEGYIRCYLIERNGRRVPGAVRNNAACANFAFLSNDSRYAGSGSHYGEFSYSYLFNIGNKAWNFEIELEGALSLKIDEKSEYIGIDENGKAGTFASKEAIGEYMTANPTKKLRFFKIENELKPTIEIKFS